MAQSTAAKVSENLYMQLNASELTAINMKDSPNSNDRDAGFCSGSSEGGDDLSVDHSRLDPSSPVNPSEDSVEVKVSAMALTRNKRKSSEPSKVICEREEMLQSTAPLKKRIRYTSSADSAVVLTPPIAATPPTPVPTPSTPAQPWDSSQDFPHELMPNPAHMYVRHPGLTTLHRAPAADPLDMQVEPLALVVTKTVNPTTVKSEMPTTSKNAAKSKSKSKSASTAPNGDGSSDIKVELPSRALPQTLPLALSKPRPSSSSCATTTTTNTLDIEESVNHLNDMAEMTSSSEGGLGGSSSRPQQRNYKNMTRERRIEANARERTRVHTISAAYETLRRAVPSYSNSQKLSKLSVLRVACSYILTLSRMAGEDYSIDQSQPSVESCFDSVTATIQTEGKIRKKKDE